MGNNDSRHGELDGGALPDRRSSAVQIAHLAREMSELRSMFAQHITREEKMFSDAFPGGDPDGHRHAHEQWIKAAQDQQEFWREMKRELAKKGLIWALGFMCALLLTGAAVKLGITWKP